MKAKKKDLLADVYRDDISFMLYVEHKEGLDDQDLIAVFKKLIDEIPNLQPDDDTVVDDGGETEDTPDDQSGWS